MSDDRILLVPAGFAPGLETMDILPTFRALRRRLAEFMPVDVYRFPWLHGEEACEGSPEGVASRIAEGIRAEHHVLDLGTGAEILLLALTRRPSRSLVVAGFFSSEATVRGAGQPSVAAAVAAMSALSVNPAQIMPLVMAGADEDLVQRVLASVDASINKALFAEVIRRFHETDFNGALRLTIPALCLEIAFPVPGADRLLDVFRDHVPGAASDVLHEWPMRLHEEAAGHELADKVIPFIEGVIARAESPA